jgi:hypothetical protein
MPEHNFLGGKSVNGTVIINGDALAEHNITGYKFWYGALRKLSFRS